MLSFFKRFKNVEEVLSSLVLEVWDLSKRVKRLESLKGKRKTKKGVER